MPFVFPSFSGFLYPSISSLFSVFTVIPLLNKFLSIRFVVIPLRYAHIAVRAKNPGRKKSAQPKGRSPQKASGHPSEPRDLVRQLFLQFATDITAAEERKDLVRVLAGVDQYVDQVFTATAED